MTHSEIWNKNLAICVWMTLDRQHNVNNIIPWRVKIKLLFLALIVFSTTKSLFTLGSYKGHFTIIKMPVHVLDVMLVNTGYKDRFEFYLHIRHISHLQRNSPVLLCVLGWFIWSAYGDKKLVFLSTQWLRGVIVDSCSYLGHADNITHCDINLMGFAIISSLS